MSAPRSWRLKELTPGEARSIAAARPTLLVPVGTCEQHGPHLPIGGDTMVVERLADELSAELGCLVAPTIEYGVNDGIERGFSGGASVRRKTLRRWLNDLLPDWEQLGVTDVVILTMNGFAPHQEALATVMADRARVRVVDLLALDLAELVDDPYGPIHGGEVDTSLLLFVRPDLVRMDMAADCIVPEPERRRHRRGSSLVLPDRSSGSMGRPTAATAEKGRRLYDHIKGRIRERLFANPPAATG